MSWWFFLSSKNRVLSGFRYFSYLTTYHISEKANAPFMWKCVTDRQGLIHRSLSLRMWPTIPIIARKFQMKVYESLTYFNLLVSLPFLVDDSDQKYIFNFFRLSKKAWFEWKHGFCFTSDSILRYCLFLIRSLAKWKTQATPGTGLISLNRSNK